MLDTQVVDDQLATLLAADPTTLAPASGGNKIHLIVAAFTPGPGLDFTTLTEATFPGYAALVAGVGTQPVYNDPVSGKRVIEIKAPTGGWNFISTGPTSPSQTVYGFVMTDGASAVTYGAELLDTPVVITNTGDGLTLTAVQFALTRFAMV